MSKMPERLRLVYDSEGFVYEPDPEIYGANAGTEYVRADLAGPTRAEVEREILAVSKEALREANRDKQEQKALRVLSRARISKPPVNPIAVAKALGYQIYWNRFEDRRIHGSTTFEHGTVRIDVDERNTVEERRFTIAHQIGHAVNDQNSDNFAELREGSHTGSYRTDFVEGAISQNEIEANDFAGSLLMPASWVSDYWSRLGDVVAMAKTFRVSEQAMRVRLKEIRITV